MKSERNSYYIGNCVSIKDVVALNNMIEDATEVAKQTILRRCNLQHEFKEMLKDKWGVTCCKSKFNNVACYYIEHSAIEYLFTLHGCYNENEVEDEVILKFQLSKEN
jgi:hypothetical protein